MRNTNKSGRDLSVGLQKWQLKRFMVLPLARHFNQQALVNLKLGRNIFAKLQELDDSIEAGRMRLADHRSSSLAI